jgi:hypothetical protein
VVETRSLQRRGLKGVDEVELLVPCELHGILGKLLVSAEGMESIPIGLSTRARRQWRTTTTRPSEIGGNGLGQCAILRRFLERKERSRDSSEVMNFDRRAVVVLFTTSGEKLKCGWLTVTPATRLGGEALGS